MAQTIITIPDEHVQRVGEAFTNTYGYDPASGQTKKEFVNEQIKKFIKRVVVEYESNQAANVALEEAKQNAESEVDIQAT